jgi:hypothetical protein
MALSIFADKDKHPDDLDLKGILSETYPIWLDIVEHFYQHYPKVSEEWNYSGKNYGWSLRVKSKNRNIIYLIPCQGFFKFAFVFGKKGVEEVMNSHIGLKIKNELSNARTYMEGTGFRIDVRDDKLLKDIKELIRIKIHY